MQTFLIFIFCLAVIFTGFYIIAKIITSELRKEDRHTIQKNFEGGYLVFPKGNCVPIKCDNIIEAKIQVGELIYQEENKQIHNLSYDENKCVKLYLDNFKKQYDERV